ncbi:MAG: VOC family protein [Pseudomonadota bacterium]
MFNHIMVGANDLSKAKTFYDATFAALGGREGFLDPKGRLIYLHNSGVFMVSLPIDGEPATFANGGTIGFSMSSAEEIDTWHAAGVRAGGETIEDPPGWRDEPAGRMYLAYLRDPDGNKLCAVHRTLDNA